MGAQGEHQGHSDGPRAHWDDSTPFKDTQTFENLRYNEEDDIYTNFNRDVQQMDEEFQMPFVEFTGLVRRGEEENVLRGRRNWPQEGVFNFIDLWLMSRLFRSFNLVRMPH